MGPVSRDRDEGGRARSARPRDALGRPLPRGENDELEAAQAPAGPEDALAAGIEQFNARRFFQAHEIWENGWHPAPEPERDFWQGIIQVAIGFTHFQRGNVRGAVTLLERGVRRLERYGASHVGIPVAALARSAREAAAAIRRDGAAAEISFPTIPAPR